MVRSAVLLALALALVPACGHKGPPQPPRRRTPPPPSGFRLAQRGEALEISCQAPTASVEGVPLERVDVDLFWGEGWVNLEKEGHRRSLRVAPGAMVVETVPLPAPGTLVRAAGRARSGSDEGQRSLILALQVHQPLTPPRDLTARLRPKGVTLEWRGARPEKIPPPDLGPAPMTRRPFTGGLSSGAAPPSVERAESEGRAEETVAHPDTQRMEERPAGESTTPARPAPTTVPTSPSDGAPPDDADLGEAETTSDSAAPTRGRSYGFRVYRRPKSGEFRAPLNDEPQARRLFTDTRAPIGTTVCYVVRAVGSVIPLIESAPSNEVCLDVRDIAAPPAPSGLAVVPREGALEVVWSPSSVSDVAGYRIYRAAGKGEPERIAEVPADATVWVDTSPERGVLYRYTVSAFDRAGNESPPSNAAQGRGP